MECYAYTCANNIDTSNSTQLNDSIEHAQLEGHCVVYNDVGTHILLLFIKNNFKLCLP